MFICFIEHDRVQVRLPDSWVWSTAQCQYLHSRIPIHHQTNTHAPLQPAHTRISTHTCLGNAMYHILRHAQFFCSDNNKVKSKLLHPAIRTTHTQILSLWKPRYDLTEAMMQSWSRDTKNEYGKRWGLKTERESERERMQRWALERDKKKTEGKGCIRK